MSDKLNVKIWSIQSAYNLPTISVILLVLYSYYHYLMQLLRFNEDENA